MADEPDSLVPVYLRRIDGKVDRLAEGVRELTGRVGMLEQQYAGLSIRIERRLDLLPAE